jgi:hypothetical protein
MPRVWAWLGSVSIYRVEMATADSSAAAARLTARVSRPATTRAGTGSPPSQRERHGSQDPPLQEPGQVPRRHSENGTGLKIRHYKGFQGADQDVPEVARFIQSIVWEPE